MLIKEEGGDAKRVEEKKKGRCGVEEEEGRGCLAWVLDVNPVERGEGDVWIRLGLVGKINEGYFRETNFLLPPHGLFIKYLGSLSIILFK